MDLKVNDSNFLLKRNGNVLCPTSKSNRIVITDNTAFCRKDNYNKACNLTSTDSLTGAFKYYRQSLWSLVPSDSIKMGYRLSLGSSATKKKKSTEQSLSVSRIPTFAIKRAYFVSLVTISFEFCLVTKERAFQFHRPSKSQNARRRPYRDMNRADLLLRKKFTDLR